MESFLECRVSLKSFCLRPGLLSWLVCPNIQCVHCRKRRSNYWPAQRRRVEQRKQCGSSFRKRKSDSFWRRVLFEQKFELLVNTYVRVTEEANVDDIYERSIFLCERESGIILSKRYYWIAFFWGRTVDFDVVRCFLCWKWTCQWDVATWVLMLYI